MIGERVTDRSRIDWVDIRTRCVAGSDDTPLDATLGWSCGEKASRLVGSWWCDPDETLSPPVVTSWAVSANTSCLYRARCRPDTFRHGRM
jgi:hypothetical protein